MSETGVCPLCHRNANVQAAQFAFADLISCEKCGVYVLEGELKEPSFSD